MQLKNTQIGLLSTLGSSFHSYDAFKCPPDFKRAQESFKCGNEFELRGNNFMSGPRRTLLASKNEGNLVLLIPEPANAYDKNAVAAFVAQPKGETSRDGYMFVHVGYLAREIAAKLRPVWPLSNGLPAIAEARLGCGRGADGKRTMTLTNRFRDYLGGADAEYGRHFGTYLQSQGRVLRDPKRPPLLVDHEAQTAPWRKASAGFDADLMRPTGWNGSKGYL